MEFEGNHRAAADPEYAAILSRVRLAEHTPADIGRLQSRCPRLKWGADIIARLLKAGAPILRFQRDKVDRANMEALKAKETVEKIKVYECPAEDSYAKTGLSSPLENAHPKPEDTGGLTTLFHCTVGARVMLRVNLDVGDGLVNGATGWVRAVDLHSDGEVVVGIWVIRRRVGMTEKAWHALGDECPPTEVAARLERDQPRVLARVDGRAADPMLHRAALSLLRAALLRGGISGDAAGDAAGDTAV